MSERSGLMHRALNSLTKRIRRMRPDLVPWGFRGVIIAIWVAAAAVAFVLLFSDPATIGSGSTGGNPLDVFLAPLWLRMLLVAVIGVLAVSATAMTGLWASLGGHRRRCSSALFKSVLAASGVRLKRVS
jgi:hypothetical protein